MSLQRNPRLELEGLTIQTIGDPHMGRKFLNNVPLHRRGWYESIRDRKFGELLTAPADVTIIMGDLFDKDKVDERDILYVYQLLVKHTPLKRKTYILQGNHDDPKTKSEVSSFGLLKAMLEGVDHIQIVDDLVCIPTPKHTWIGLFGWRFDKTIHQQLLERPVEEIAVAFTHLDKISYGNDDNVIPWIQMYQAGIKTIVNGHEHKPTFADDGGTVYLGTGSMLPYSHAEDLGNEYYVTFTDVRDLEAQLEENHDAFVDKHVRVITNRPDLVPDFEYGSLQIRKVADDEELPDTVQNEVISVRGLLHDAAKATGLGREDTDELYREITSFGDVE